MGDKPKFIAAKMRKLSRLFWELKVPEEEMEIKRESGVYSFMDMTF